MVSYFGESMNNLSLGKVSGVEVQLNWTLVFWFSLILFLGGIPLLLLIMMVSTIVLLHEMGHCLMAKSFGWDVEKIVLFPFGGIAFIDPKNRTIKSEFFVSIAGPMVNVILIPFLYFEKNVYLFNLYMIFFNMLPFYPMDGGKVLSCILEKVTNDFILSRKIVIRLGQIGFILFIAVGAITGHLFLIVIGILLFSYSSAEMSMIYSKKEEKLYNE